MDSEKNQKTQKKEDKDQNEGDSNEETFTAKKILSDSSNQISDDQKKNDNNNNNHHLHRKEKEGFKEKGSNLTQIKNKDKQHLDESKSQKHLDTETSRTGTSKTFIEEQFLIQLGEHILRKIETFHKNWQEWYGKNENNSDVQQAKTNLVKLTQSIIRDIYEFNQYIYTNPIVIDYYAIDGFQFKEDGWRYRHIFFKYVNDFDDIEEFIKYFLIANLLFIEQEKAINFSYLNIDFFMKFIKRKFEDQTINKIMEEANQIIQAEEYKYERQNKFQ